MFCHTISWLRYHIEDWHVTLVLDREIGAAVMQTQVDASHVPCVDAPLSSSTLTDSAVMASSAPRDEDTSPLSPLARLDSHKFDMDKMHFVVAVDGSEISKGAFETASAFAKRGDRITVVHVVDPTKAQEPHELTPSAISEYYSNRCLTRFPSGSWTVTIKTKLPGDGTTRQALLAFVNSVSAHHIRRNGPADSRSIL